MADDKDKQDQESLKAVQAQNETAKELLSTYEKLKKVKRSLTDDEKETLNISKQLIQYSSTLEKSIQQRLNKSSTSKELSKTLNQLQKEYNKNVKDSDDIVRNLNQQKDKALTAARQAAQNEKRLKNDIKDLDEKTLAAEIEKQVALQNGDKALAKQAAEKIKENQRIAAIKDKQLEKVQKEKEEQKNLVKQLDETKKAHNETINQQSQEIKNLEKEVQLKEVSNVLDKAGGALGFNKLKNALSLSGIFSFILDSVFKIDKQITNLSKSLGVSKDSARAMRNDMQAYVNASNDSFINVERLMKAQEGLTEQLGIAVNFSNEERETFARLTEITGLTADEAGKLAQNSAAAGMSTQKYLDNVREGAFQAQVATKQHISDKQILQDISKLSAGILVKFQGNPKAIGEAVVQARKLGLSLEQVNDVGKSLLNWESSIENELEAELITGKKLNLEKARAAALTNDQATLMQEINSQVGTLADFQNMNALAQDSLAKAFGMTSEQMSDMLMKQEAINKYGDEAAGLNKEQLEYMEKHKMSASEMQNYLQNQRDTQEKFNDLVTKLQEKFAALAEGPLGKIVGMLVDMLSSTTGINAIFIALGAYLAGSLFLSLGKISKLLKAQKAESMGAAIISVVKGAWESMGPIPFVGAALAAAAAIAGIAYLNSASSKKGDDVMSEGGYGNRTLLTPKGSIKLNNQDTVIAGTNLGGGGVKKQPETNSGMAAMGAMIGAINDLKAASSKPAVAYIHGRDAFADNLGGVSALGASQMQNSYKFA